MFYFLGGGEELLSFLKFSRWFAVVGEGLREDRPFKALSNGSSAVLSF